MKKRASETLKEKRKPILLIVAPEVQKEYKLWQKKRASETRKRTQAYTDSMTSEIHKGVQALMENRASEIQKWTQVITTFIFHWWNHLSAFISNQQCNSQLEGE